MRYNGVDLRSAHYALSINKEIPPGTAKRAFETVTTVDGEVITEERIESGEYIARVNIFTRDPKEAWEAREQLAKWATVIGVSTAELIPTHRANRAYDAKLLSISDPEFKRGGAVVEVRFFLPRPIAHDIYPSTATGAKSARMVIGGSYTCRPTIRQTIQTARSGLVWTFDGGALLRISGSLKAGQVVEMDTGRESLTIDGAHAETRIIFDATKWRPGFHPGAHEIASTDGGAIEARWRNEWL